MEPINGFHTFRSNYARQINKYRQEENILYGKILAKESQLQRLEAKRKKLSATYPYWTDNLLKPVVEQLKAALPLWTCDDEKFTPMGLGSKVSVFFCNNNQLEIDDKYAEDNSIYICFLPDDLSSGELLYETGEIKSYFQPGTIGDINGFNRLTKPVESIEELVSFLKSQIKSNGTEN